MSTPWILLLASLLGSPTHGEALASQSLATPAAVEIGAPVPHDLHASYGNLGVDGSLAILQLRVFRDDLEEALRRFHGMEELQLEVSPRVDGLFLAYLEGRFQLEADGRRLEGAIIGSGDDELDREPVWWYQIRFDAPTPIRSARITNTVLFELFDDQRNVLRVVEFPQETRRAFYFAQGEETIQVTFGGPGPG